MMNLRRTGATTVATVFGLIFCVALANGLSPNWTQRVGIDVWNLPTAIEENRTADEELIALDKQAERLRWEMETGDYLAAELANGTKSLREAVDEMEPILSKRAGFSANLDFAYHTSSLRQGVARYLINRIPNLEKLEGKRRKEALCRLEQEYKLLNGF
jgi:hypothetical protein